jgi:hypothetical protein
VLLAHGLLKGFPRFGLRFGFFACDRPRNGDQYSSANRYQYFGKMHTKLIPEKGVEGNSIPGRFYRCGLTLGSVLIPS